MSRYIVLLFALVALTYVQAKEKCPSVTGKVPFDESKFVGVWYHIAAARPNSNEPEKMCAKLNVTTMRTGSETTLKFQGTYKKNDKTLKMEAFSQAFKADKAATFYGVWKKEDEEHFSGVYKQSIVATDYENYAIFVGCKIDFDETKKTFGRKMHAKVWGRKTSLSEETLKVLLNVLSSYDISMDDIKMMDHTDC